MGKARDQRVQITDEVIKTIRAEAVRTRIGYFTLMRLVTGAPVGLNGKAIQRWVADGQKTVDADHLEFVLAAYAALSDDGVVENTPERCAMIGAEIARTGVKSKALHALLSEQGDEFLVPSTITNWVQGRIKKMPKPHWERIVQVYAALPDHKVAITSAQRAVLNGELARAGVRSAAVILDHPDKPANLTIHAARSLLEGRMADIPQAHWGFILARLAALPNASAHEPAPHPKRKRARVAITESMRKELASHLDRTGMQLSRVLRNAPPDVDVPGPATVTGWKTGRFASAGETQWEYVLGVLRQLPDQRGAQWS
jgi:hypothetical protein